MQASKSSVVRSILAGAQIPTCDNSGAKILRVISVKNLKTTKRRVPGCGVGHLILAAVKKGKPEMRKQVVFAVIVRQRKEYRRPDGMRIKFEDNAAVVLKDDKGNPKGTLLKGPIAKEAAARWPSVAKIASVIV